MSTILKSLADQGLYRPGLRAGAPVKGAGANDLLSISVDTRSNTLIVSASPENLAIVREVVKKVDSKDVAAAEGALKQTVSLIDKRIMIWENNGRPVQDVASQVYIVDAFTLLRGLLSGDRFVGLAKSIGREKEEIILTTLDAVDPAQVDMSTLVMIGASGTKQISRENARDWIYTARAAP